ncbi:MAG: TIGR01212 family radical SAM protein [Firmicutes bacterium]|nr:TIGR01212 family radical SAM protein [Bacillota bacterium]
MSVFWGDKRYYSINYHLKSRYGQRVQNIPIDAGFTCPNRDGAIGVGGCIFCSQKGSGDLAESREMSITQQVNSRIERLSSRGINKYIVYFQAYTNTYAPVEVLRQKYYEAIADERVVGLAIGTRPDCIDAEKVRLFSEIAEKKDIWIELGLQSIFDQTAKFMNRGYKLDCFDRAVRLLHQNNIKTVVHLIFGLPHETKEMMIDSVRYISEKGISGVKFHLLHILKNTRLQELYSAGGFKLLEKDEYVEIVVNALENLAPDIVVHRLTAEAPREILVAPDWCLKKRGLLNSIERTLAERNTWQGRLLKSSARGYD